MLCDCTSVSFFCLLPFRWRSKIRLLPSFPVLQILPFLLCGNSGKPSLNPLHPFSTLSHFAPVGSASCQPKQFCPTPFSFFSVYSSGLATWGLQATGSLRGAFQWLTPELLPLPRAYSLRATLLPPFTFPLAASPCYCPNGSMCMEEAAIVQSGRGEP